MKTTLFYEAVKEVRNIENLTREETINLVDDFYIFHPEKISNKNPDCLSGVIIRGNMRVQMIREERKIPNELHNIAIESGLVLYKYTDEKGIPYVLSKNAAADLFAEMGIGGRMSKVPFLERDLYLSTLMDYYKGIYRSKVKAITMEVKGSKYVISIRKPSFVVNSYNNLLDMIGEIIDESSFDLVEYHADDGVEFHLLSERDEYNGFYPSIQIFDNVNGNIAFTVKGGYQTTQGVFLNISEIKQVHKTTLDYDQVMEEIIRMMDRMVRSLKRLQQEDINNKHIKDDEMNIAKLWKDVEAAAAMKKNKRAESAETLKVKQKNANEVGDRILLFLNAANSFDFTNEKLERALGDAFSQLIKSVGVKKEVE